MDHISYEQIQRREEKLDGRSSEIRCFDKCRSTDSGAKKIRLAWPKVELTNYADSTEKQAHDSHVSDIWFRTD